MSENARARITVSGLVQGVFFRANTIDQAVGLGITGRVANLVNGDVEIVAEGDRRQIETLIDWCRVGPPGARVDGVDVLWEEFQGKFRRFGVSY